MKIEKTVLPIAALAALGSALVIPNLAKEDKDKLAINNKKFNDITDVVAKYSEQIIESARKIGKSVQDSVNLKMAPLVTPTPYPVVSGASANSNANSNIIPNRYIVVFKKSILPEEVDFHKELINQIQLESAAKLPKDDKFFSASAIEDESINQGGILTTFNISNLLNGYVGYFTDEVLELIRMNPLVEYVEKDSLVQATEFDNQNNAPWGLARISHRERLNLGSFNKYLYDDDAGKGVTCYVIDTGINTEHNDFNKRAVWGKTIPLNDKDIDGNGHGTHCAGTIASTHYGVAKNAEVVAVKVLRSNGSGSMSDVIKGVEFAAESHIKAAKEKKKGFKGSTANMSLGGGKSPTLDLAVNAAVDAGIHFAVAAGNENQDACNTSPASAERAITVGASTLSDDRAYFSNWGKCVDIFAPGLNILSTYIGDDDATATLSGTSMASPHVAGLLTYFLSLQPGSDSEFFDPTELTPAQMKKKLINYSSKDVLFDLPEGTPNKLIFNGAGGNLDDLWNKKSQEEDIKVKGGCDHKKHKGKKHGSKDHKKHDGPKDHKKHDGPHGPHDPERHHRPEDHDGPRGPHGPHDPERHHRPEDHDGPKDHKKHDGPHGPHDPERHHRPEDHAGPHHPDDHGGHKKHDGPHHPEDHKDHKKHDGEEDHKDNKKHHQEQISPADLAKSLGTSSDSVFQQIRDMFDRMDIL
ncbi:hypothetical protein NCAS_0F00220 [Naumovozyma castellii]|uniref:Peptidase S8/S53 domain-containing protein n=1 Tax=Naumovozyma castellii TaxID=27288 RepID=G0VG86_NAUCA|nr:hypothetical protein NCAS_0F00220 [Naumovozyma castellii CBS 4309]CCC70506.1 hypothetical protein NCAS_0F00220 [Naumovozyma castellii CBS 4309]